VPPGFGRRARWTGSSGEETSRHTPSPSRPRGWAGLLWRGNPTSNAAPLGRPVKDTILTIITGYDAVTLREKVDLPAASDRLDDLGKLRSLSALNEKVTLLRLLDRLDEAFEIANQALRQARFTGDRQDFVLCRIRRAQVMQFQGKLEEAAAELTQCILESETHEWTLTAAFARETRGKVHFDQHDLENAHTDFTAAVFLRDKAGASPDDLESALIAVAVVESFIGERRLPR
jgi:tetratricopeptide (TPR) repeat protein